MGSQARCQSRQQGTLRFLFFSPRIDRLVQRDGAGRVRQSVYAREPTSASVERAGEIVG